MSNLEDIKARQASRMESDFISQETEDIAALLTAIDNLIYVADSKADLSKPVGQWWSEVIKGTITQSLEGK
jgi:hypothetical protein